MHARLGMALLALHCTRHWRLFHAVATRRKALWLLPRTVVRDSTLALYCAVPLRTARSAIFYGGSRPALANARLITPNLGYARNCMALLLHSLDSKVNLALQVDYANLTTIRGSTYFTLI